ncbi:MAG TPA: LysR family transcriptional regulator [Solirubrobacterales bacterium]|nr:LysR family transcriptional regulator [Solirubrobacterales bacterium]
MDDNGSSDWKAPLSDPKSNDPLQSRQLSYFLAVADELHFGKAAERLGIGKPPLSRAIRRLEADLGVVLFERTSRTVKLTPAGETLLKRGRAAADALADAANETREAASAEAIRLVIGTHIDADLARGLQARHERRTGTPVLVEVAADGSHASAMVREGNADVAILLEHFFQPDGLDWEPILEEQRVVALPTSHPLAERSELRFRDLEGETFPFGEGHYGRVFRFLAAQDTESLSLRGVTEPDPRLRYDSSLQTVPQILGRVEFGQLIIFMGTSMANRWNRAGISYIPVSDISPGRAMIVWSDRTRSQRVGSFVLTATEAFDECRDDQGVPAVDRDPQPA